MVLGLWSALAFAGGWGPFEAAFPTLPCQDGWASCGTGADRVTPDLGADRDGRPVIADMRVSFWSFEPAKSFSPFVSLTEYPAAPPPPEPVAVIAPQPDPVAPSTGIAKADPGPRVDPVARVVKADPPKGEPDPISKVDPVKPPPPVVVLAPPPAGCDNLPLLEPRAMLGKLEAADVSCLEGRFAAASQTDKDKISRALMVNAFARGDKKGWEKLVARHLDEVDQSDPEIVYRYASELAKTGRQESAIHWADVALENKTRWTGDKFVQRVNQCHRLKTAAAQDLWKKAEDAAIADPGRKPDVDKARTRTKVLAREWLSYARSAGQDTTTAAQICAAAAGTADYCAE